MTGLSDSVIHLTLDGQPPVVVVHRGPGVAELFWTRLRSQLSTEPRADSEVIRARPERFLGNRTLVKALCRQYSVGLTADAGAIRLLERAVSEEVALQKALKGEATHDMRPDLELLASSRFVKRQLRSFQERDLATLKMLLHGANFSVPGAGKTAVAYALYELERMAERVTRLLVVAPLSAFDAWLTEAGECFSPAPVVHVFEPSSRLPGDAEVLLVNYSKVPNNLPALVAWASEAPCHLILDEAHRIKKGRAGAWGAACLDLSWHAARRDILTGTPAPQHPSDLEALFDFAWPGQGRRILPADAFQARPSVATATRVADLVRPLFVRTRKSELGLEEPEKRVLLLDLHGLHREIYQAITNQYAGIIPLLRRDRYRLAQMRYVVMYLLEAASNPSLLPVGASRDDPPAFQHPPASIPPDSDLATLLADYGHYETPAKFRKLGELVRANAEANRKSLVWSYFVRNLEMLREMFARYQPAVIHGGVLGEARERELQRFRENKECFLLLANPAAMAEGISLHKHCHEAIYLERTFNAGQYLQSIDRIHRLGMEAGVATRVSFLLTRETIDEVVHDRVAEKARRLGSMLDDPDIVTMALPDESDLEEVDSGFGQAIDDVEDVSALFAHLRGER